MFTARDGVDGLDREKVQAVEARRRRPLLDLNSGIHRHSEGQRPQVIERDALRNQVPSDRVEYVGAIGRQSLLHPSARRTNEARGRMTVGTRRLLAELPPVEGVAMKSVTIILLMLVLTAGCASPHQQGSRSDAPQTQYERQGGDGSGGGGGGGGGGRGGY